MSFEPATYPGYRFPAEVIHHAIWLYHLFSLSLRDIELILAERGAVVSRIEVSPQGYRHGEPPLVAMLNQTNAAPGIPQESRSQGLGIT